MDIIKSIKIFKNTLLKLNVVRNNHYYKIREYQGYHLNVKTMVQIYRVEPRPYPTEWLQKERVIWAFEIVANAIAHMR